MRQVRISALALGATLALVALLLVSAQLHISPVFAQPSYTTSSVSSPGNNTCTSCHGGSAASGGSTVVNFPSGTYTPGVVQHLSVRITDPTHSRGGYQLTARLASSISTQAGTFKATDSNSSVVTHSSIQDMNATNYATLTWNFDWTPPATASGNVNFYLTGLATGNPGGSTNGNGIYQSVATLTPTAPAPDFSLSSSPTSVSMAQGAGNSTTVTVNPLNGFTGSVSLAASGLPSGVTASFSSNPTTSTSTLTLTASGSATTGTSTVTITGTSSSLSHTTTVGLTVTVPPNFSLSAAPSTVSVTQGAGGSSVITVTPQNGFSGSVSLAASGLPSGVTASFSPSAATSTSTLTLTASGSAATGTSTVTITGTSGSLSHTTTVSLTVKPPPDFSLSSSPGSLTVAQGFSGTGSISVVPQNGFTSSVSLAASGLPSGVTASFSPSSTTSASTLTLTASGSATIGTSTVTITGTSGSLSHTTTVALTVSTTAPPDFSLSSSPGSVSIAQGTGGSSSIAVGPQNGFTGSVSVAASGLPSGVTASFSSNPTTSTSTLTLTASGSATTGTSTVTITGTSGSLSHTTTVGLTVTVPPNFSLSASPGSVSVTQGAGGSNVIAVTPQNGFAGSVSLAASGLPSGVTASFSPSAATSTSTLTLAASSSATTGTSTVTITGTSGGLSHITTVALTVTAAPATLTVAPPTLSFNYQIGSPVPGPQAISVTTGSAAGLGFTAAALSGSWLSVTPASGATPGVVAVAVDPANLPAGTYNDTLTITASGAAGSPQSVAVALVVSTATSTRKISTTPASSYPKLVIDAPGNYNVAWTDSATGVFFSRSLDHGATFSASVVIQGSAGAAFQPQFVVDSTGNNIDVVWAAAASVPGSYNVLFSRSTDGGQHFDATPTPLTTAALPLADAPRMALEPSGALDVVWGRNETWAIRSADGATFPTPATKISTAAQDSGGPRVAVDSTGKIYVAWTDEVNKLASGSYCLQTSTANTSTFTNTAGGNFYLNITAAGAAFVSGNTNNLSNTDWAGVSQRWQPGFFGCSYDSLILLLDSQDKLHLVWSIDSPDQNVLASAYPVVNSTGKSRVSFPAVLNASAAASPHAVIANNSSGVPTLHVVWSDGPSDATAQATTGIFYTHSNDTTAPFGQTFAAPATRVVSAASEFPQVGLDSSGDVNVAWQQSDTSTANAFDVFLSSSFDGGNTFAAATPVSTHSSNECLGTNQTDTTQIPPPPYNTCGSVQLKVDSTNSSNLVWVDLSTNSSDVLFAQQVNTPPASDFAMAIATTSQTLTNGSATYALTLTAASGFNQPVTIICPSGLPAGLACSAAHVTPTSSGSPVTLTVIMTGSLPAGSYPFTIRGDAGLTTHSVQAVLVVASTTTPDFSISLTPPSVTALPGQPATYTANIISIAGFSNPVTVACAGLPGGATCAVNAATVLAPGSATVTVTFPAPLGPGTYTFAIMGSSGATNHSQVATLALGTVNATITPSPSAIIAVGSSANFTIALSAASGTGGSVNLSCGSLPAGITCAFNPAQLNVPSSGTVTTTLTVKVTARPASAPVDNGPQAGPNSWSLPFTGLVLMILTMLLAYRRSATLPAAAVRGLAACALVVVLALGLVSCAGVVTSGSGTTTTTSSSSSREITVQAQSGSTTLNLATLSITVP